MNNYTPFPNLRFFGMDNKGQEFGVLVVKGTYVMGPGGVLAIADDQEPLIMTDMYHGDITTTSLCAPSDIVHLKPRSDVILNAVARAPGGKCLPSWICSVRIEGEHVIEKRLRVTGSRLWEPQWAVSDRIRASLTETVRQRVFRGWRLSDPEPVSAVPIRYELAYGGLLARPREGSDDAHLEPNEYNPIGRGWIDATITPTDRPVAAPQVESADAPVMDPHYRYAPESFGPIPPAWLPRRPLGGTFDEHWKANVWPNWPADYDFAYNNSAHPDLIYPGFLRGDETVFLKGLHRDVTEQVLYMPHHKILLDARREGQRMLAAMHLDTLMLDIADADPSCHRAHLSWRIAFDHQDVDSLTFTLFDMHEENGRTSFRDKSKVEA